MQGSEKLTELIEAAAGSITMLTPGDLPEIEALQSVLGAIRESIGTLGDDASPLLDQVDKTSATAADTLQKILQDEVDNSEKAIEVVSEAITSLQGLIQELLVGASAPCDAPEVRDTVEETESEAPAQGMVILADDAPLIQDFITEACEHIESVEAGLLDLEHKPDDSDTLNTIFRGFHTIKGMAGFLNLADIGSVSHSAENLLDNARKGQLVLAGSNTDCVFESIDMLKKLIASLKEAMATGSPVPPQPNLDPLLERLKDAAEGKTPAESLDTTESRQVDAKLDGILESAEAPTPDTTEEKAKIRSGDEKIKVSTERLDSLINMVGELVIAQSMVAEEVSTNLAVEHELGRKVTHMNKIVRELQELSMSMRMVPIQGVFQKMARLVRDLARKSRKNVDFSTSGEETELDRNIVDKIADPLVHMVRNSVDHGLESPEDREAAGKRRQGRVELRAFHQAGNIVIEIEDDGKGLDKDRILKKALDQGIVEPGQDLPDEEIFKLIFHPGLSTAQKITSISGRGVGMDVVKKNIEALQGKIDIASTPGKGTTFTIRLPLTLAIIDGQVVQIGTQRYIVPINSIVKSFKPSREELSKVQNRGEMAMVRGHLIPLVRLYELFNVEPAHEDPTEGLLMIVSEYGQECCLLVDDLLGQQQVVIKTLGGLGKVKGVSGGAIMGDGRVSLILDVPGLIELSQR